MLHTESVERKTFQLLRSLCADERLKDFHLVGGTALALQFGHRQSVDLDLFCQQGFDAPSLSLYLSDKYFFMQSFQERNTLKGTIDGVKVDLITYPYRLMNDLVMEDGIRLYDYRDVSAMKLSTIVSNGSRLKDFVDIAYISTKMSLYDMIDCYTSKFPGSSPIIPMKAINYFEDIDFREKIIMTRKSFDWKGCKNRINEMLKNPHKIFDEEP